MNARILALMLFAGWSALCWWWYVCQIKEACVARTENNEEAISVPVYTPDDTTTIELPAAGGLTPGGGARPDNNPDIDVVTIYEMSDVTRIHFPYGSTSKEDDAAVDEYLNRLAGHLKQSGQTAYIAGHTDMVGDRKSNLRLALGRANSIRDLLLAKGVPKNQLKCSTYGESKPLSTNDNPRGRYQNRRVEITVK